MSATREGFTATLLNAQGQEVGRVAIPRGETDGFRHDSRWYHRLGTSDVFREVEEMRVEAYGTASVGKRSRMEDHNGLSLEAGCFVVADGVGSLLGGGRAAEEVVRTVLDVCTDRRHLDAMATLRHAMAMAATAVKGQQERWHLPCETTVAALLLRPVRAFLAWCGDSRVYRLRLEFTEGRTTAWRPYRLTRDHRDAGGTLIRSLGSGRGGDSAQPAYHETDVQPGDVYALVTDGVWEALGDEGVSRVLMESHVGPVATLTSQWCAEALVDRAVTGGAEDNCTAIVVRVGGGA